MKVAGYPNLHKEGGCIVSSDVDAYQKRRSQMKQRKRLDELEEKQIKMGDDLEKLHTKLDYLIELLKEK